MNYFNKNLNYLMLKKGINKNKLSLMLNVTRQAMTTLFKTENPQVKTLIQLKQIFNITIDDLLLIDLENESRNIRYNKIHIKRTRKEIC